MMSSSSGSCGSERNRSVSHISAASILPREMPATAPMITPTVSDISIAVRPTESEIRPPYNMRAKRSCPRSSVPNGCASDGGARRAAKSISLIGTFQIQGPNATSRTIVASTTALSTASLCRRKRRDASTHGETPRARAGALATLAVGNAGIEPAIEQIGDQVEGDHETREHERHRHDHGGVIGQDRADEKRSDARNAEDLF